jgi:hypothetical protein
MKITSKSLSRHLVRLQRKLKITEKEKNLWIRQFLLHFSVFKSTSHQPISVADLGYKSHRAFDAILVKKKNLFFFF